MPKNSIGGALSLQIQHKTRLQLFDDFSADDVLSAVLLSDSDDDSESLPDDDSSNNDNSTAMEIDDREVESWFEHIEDVASTLPMPYNSELSSRIDLSETTLEKLKVLDAPTPFSLSPTGWERHLRKLLVGESEPAYRVCRLHGISSRYFLKATRTIQKDEALGVLVGRLIETRRWEKEHAVYKKQAETASKRSSNAHHDAKMEDYVMNCSTLRWEITAESLKKISQGKYTGPDLMIDLREAANELVHLHDPFWEEENACGEESNTQLYTSLIKDPRTGVSLPTTVLYSTCEILPGETLTVNWDDAYWSEVSERENLTAAATAWGSLHFPLLQLRDLAFRNGIPVSLVAPYYPDEIDTFKRHKKEIELVQKVGTTVVDRSEVAVQPNSPIISLEKQHEELETEQEKRVEIEELEPTEVLDVECEDEIESVGVGGFVEEEEQNILIEVLLESEAAPSIRVELDTSSHMGTYTDGICTDEKMYDDVQKGKKRRRKKKKNATKMCMDSEGSWWLNDGTSPRLLVEGACKRRSSSMPRARQTHNSNATTGINNNRRATTAKDLASLSPRKISLYCQPKPKIKNEKPFQPFRALVEEELAKKVTSCCDFSRVSEADLKKITKHAPDGHSLPTSVLEFIDTGICPKVQVTEIMNLHHPVRFLTRPDRIAYGVNIKPGCRVKPNEPLGIYIGETWGENEYLEAHGHDVDKHMYTYSMMPYNFAECLGYPPDWVEKNADSKFPTLLVDAHSNGNVMRFINDIYARQGKPKPNVNAETCVDPRTGLPYMLMRWIGERVSEENAELMVDYGATQYWKVGGRALHRDLKRHAEVAFTAIMRLKAILRERGISEELIEAAAEPVDINMIQGYQRDMG
jgi:hypothetical protein